jgi:ketosteroid isomerase-like protein
VNRRWTGGRTIGLAAITILSLAMTGSAFGQAKGASSAARMQQIEDRQAIEQLLMGDYPRALDANDWKAYAALFAKDGTLIMNGGATKKTGPAAIQEFFSTARFPAPAASATCPAKPGVNRFMHVVTNLSLHIDGDTAMDQAYWETIGTTDCKSVVEGAGHYEDTLKREDGHWRFAKREIFDDLPPRPPAAPAAVAPAAPKP